MFKEMPVPGRKWWWFYMIVYEVIWFLQNVSHYHLERLVWMKEHVFSSLKSVMIVTILTSTSRWRSWQLYGSNLQFFIPFGFLGLGGLFRTSSECNGLQTIAGPSGPIVQVFLLEAPSWPFEPENQSLVGGSATPLKNMSSSIGMMT